LNQVKYQTEAIKLSKAVDIAIEAFTNKCPSDFEKSHQQHIILSYTEWKESAIHPEPQFKNLTSLKFIINNVFTYFQESTGPTVEYFWKRIKEEKLDYQRENKMKKILARGKIKGRLEYEYVVDMIIVSEQVGLTTKRESEKISQMLEEYESKYAK